ncbi:hypothetical protein ACLM45_13575 [Synechococcus sp. A10-1-5-9]|uniref:hypothetical protein n=1 Tax=Synechococcus sp. A10-1-5-9 TaxID=3392295 RepID=UPI0039E9FC73
MLSSGSACSLFFMTQSKPQHRLGPPGDRLDIYKSVRDGKTQALLESSFERACHGLWAMTGINEFNAATAADHFTQILVGMNIIAADCLNQHVTSSLRELEDRTPAPLLRKARKVMKQLDEGSKQLELFQDPLATTIPSIQDEIDFPEFQPF